MWKVMCDCCGKTEHGVDGEAILPIGWTKLKWNLEGTTNMGVETRDAADFLMCLECIKYWPEHFSRIRTNLHDALQQLRLGYEQAKGFGNQGNAAAMRIERAWRHLTGERMKT